ncbi:hypothetical protein [Tianweitania sediminis]|uniref:Uncharacterized protein n=1 Tax=Tianweitania sediminis TaxID=1502156 RepID=A0A8J7RJH4_9HYPH|nr:hypothetical protein [Tianweitania sediminis]MBP0439601.1 hypothetical protein [Tianweitania sediminis]
MAGARVTEPSTRQKDALFLRFIRQLMVDVAPGEWLHSADENGQMIDARGPTGELTPICRFDVMATRHEMRLIADAPLILGFLLRLLDRAFGEIRDLKAQLRPETARTRDWKDYAAEAAMQCGKPAFRVFLQERHGLERPLTDERVAQKLRSVLAVKSRRELNEDQAAAQRWVSLRSDFEVWKRT